MLCIWRIRTSSWELHWPRLSEKPKILLPAVADLFPGSSSTCAGCSRLDLEVLSRRAWRGGEPAHSIVPLASQITGKDAELLHPQACSSVGTANTENSWKKNPKKTGPHDISVAATNEIRGFELK